MPTAAAVQVTEVLRQRYFSVMPELPRNWTPDQHEKNRLSRSLAAFAVAQFGDLAPAQAAYKVCDGGNDNGIDALCYEDMNHVLYLVQAKIGVAPDLAETLKFVKGVRDVVARRFDQFNGDFARLVPDVEDALDAGAKIVAVAVYWKVH